MNESTVYFVEIPENSTLEQRLAATRKLLAGADPGAVVGQRDKVAIKVHVGERDNDTHVAPEIIAPIVSLVKRMQGFPFLTETSTLYKGERSDAILHLAHAFDHGFSYDRVGAPFIMADGLSGNSEIEVPIKGVIFDRVNIAREVVFADALIAASHPTGHPEMVLGACLKNLGMGLSSRMGKLRQHSSIKPYVEAGACTNCGKCIRWCPVDAIIEQEGKAFIIEEKCIGCGECLSVCNFDAVKYDWGVQSVDLQKRVAEHALGVLKNKKGKVFFINFLFDMTRGCDCFGNKQERIIPDVGILAATDPVAIDQATLDLTRERFGESLGQKAHPDLDASIQLDHGERIGLGSRKYRLSSI